MAEYVTAFGVLQLHQVWLYSENATSCVYVVSMLCCVVLCHCASENDYHHTAHTVDNGGISHCLRSVAVAEHLRARSGEVEMRCTVCAVHQHFEPNRRAIIHEVLRN